MKKIELENLETAPLMSSQELEHFPELRKQPHIRKWLLFYTFSPSERRFTVLHNDSAAPRIIEREASTSDLVRIQSATTYFLLTAHQGIIFCLLYWYSIHSATCRPSDRQVRRPRAPGLRGLRVLSPHLRSF